MGSVSQLLPIFLHCWSIICKTNTTFVLQVKCLISCHTCNIFILTSVISTVFRSYLLDVACDVLLSDCSSDSFVMKDGILVLYLFTSLNMSL
jgi:hypothetical protein